MTRSCSLRVAALGAALFLALPAVAGADSIVYIDEGNVWSSAPDGSHKVQLTDGGEWHSPTQADDGTVAAVEGFGPIQVMAPDGRPLRSISTEPAPSANGGSFAPRALDLSFSADGSKLAYSYKQYICAVASSCGMQTSTFYTEADVSEATPHSTYGNQFGVSDPEWVTGSRTLVFGGYGSQVSIDDLGGGDYSFTPWMTPEADQGDGEVSRDGRHLATKFFYGPETVIAFFRVKGDVKTETPPAQPDLACTTDAADEKLADPSWSPDGMGIAFASSSGIEVGRFTKLEPGSCETTGEFAVLTPTGSEPDWGPADPPAKRWVPSNDIDDDGPGASGKVKLASTPKAGRSALRKGLKVRVVVPGPGSVTATLTAARKVVARGSGTATAKGALGMRLSKVARKAKTTRLKLVVVFRGADGSRSRVSARL